MGPQFSFLSELQEKFINQYVWRLKSQTSANIEFLKPFQTLDIISSSFEGSLGS